MKGFPLICGNPLSFTFESDPEKLMGSSECVGADLGDLWALSIGPQGNRVEIEAFY